MEIRTLYPSPPLGRLTRNFELSLAKLMMRDLGILSCAVCDMNADLILNSFIKLVDEQSEYHQEAVDRFRSLCEGRKLIANVDHREGPLLHLRLIDPQDPSAASDSLASLNAELLRDGLASIDHKGCKYFTAYPAVVRKLRDAIAGAKKDRLGMFEFGDVEQDDDL